MKLALIRCAFDRHEFGPQWEDEDGRVYEDCRHCRKRRQILTREYMYRVMDNLSRPWVDRR